MKKLKNSRVEGKSELCSLFSSTKRRAIFALILSKFNYLSNAGSFRSLSQILRELWSFFEHNVSKPGKKMQFSPYLTPLWQSVSSNWTFLPHYILGKLVYFTEIYLDHIIWAIWSLKMTNTRQHMLMTTIVVSRPQWVNQRRDIFKK